MVHLVALHFPRVLVGRAWKTCFWSDPSPDGLPKAVWDTNSHAGVVFGIESCLFFPKRLTCPKSASTNPGNILNICSNSRFPWPAWPLLRILGVVIHLFESRVVFPRLVLLVGEEVSSNTTYLGEGAPDGKRFLYLSFLEFFSRSFRMSYANLHVYNILLATEFSLARDCQDGNKYAKTYLKFLICHHWCCKTRKCACMHIHCFRYKNFIFFHVWCHFS